MVTEPSSLKQVRREAGRQEPFGSEAARVAFDGEFSVCWPCRKRVKGPRNVQTGWEFKPEKARKNQISIISTNIEGWIEAFRAVVRSLKQIKRVTG